MSVLTDPRVLEFPTVDYETFVREKVQFENTYGFTIQPTDLADVLLPHQRDIVTWAVAGGRRAIFAKFGLGKSVMQLETLRQCLRHENSETRGKRALIIAPLGVRGEFIRDGKNLLGVEVRFVRRTEEIDAGWSGIYVTNYESVRDGRLDVTLFDAVSLDEASVLRSYGSKTYQEFLGMFDTVKYRFVATATPSPNRHKELIHYAGFLGIMDTGQALTRFFQRDSTKANNLRLFPHKEREFWLWLNTWACFVQRPSDLGHSDTGYDLPSLDVQWHKVSTSWASNQVERDGQAVLVKGAENLSMVAASREKRETLTARIAALSQIVADHFAANDGQIVIWCDLNDEQTAIEEELDELGISFSSVHGGLADDVAEKRIQDWRDGKTHALIGKPVMLGQGLNLQQAHVAVFAGVTFKFNDTIQAVHRIQRYGQTHPCTVHLIYAETESSVRDTLLEKWQEHDRLTDTMSDIIREYGLNPTAITAELTRAIGVKREEASGDGWLLALNDCVLEVRDHMEENSVDLIVTSIPFSNHYEYTPNYNDFGHTDDNLHFWRQMDYLTPGLYRVLKPGRIYACHVKDRINFGAVTGAGIPTVSPFHAEALQHGEKHGFDYLGVITVTTDVVRENNQTYRLGYTEMRKDGTKMGVGSPEYVLLFHKPQTDRTKGYADERVTKTVDDYSLAQWQIDAAADWRSSGNRLMTVDELAALPVEMRSRLFKQEAKTHVYDFDRHVEVGKALEKKRALPSTFKSLDPGSWRPDVWDDVNRMLTLNSEQSRRALEFHVCLARDSLVLTKERGYVPIQTVQPGEHALTHLGRWRPVLNVAKTADVADVVKVTAQGVPGLTLTPNHKLWVREGRGYARRVDAVRRDIPHWLAAGDAENAYVNLKLPPVEASPLTIDEWWIVGRWLADGHHDAYGGYVVSVATAKMPEFAAKVGARVGTTADKGTVQQVRLRCLSPALREVLGQCGNGAAGKHLPPVAFTLPEACARALLDGYTAGDGHVLAERMRWMMTSVSRELLMGLAMLAQRVHGTVPSVYAGRPERDGVILGRSVHMNQEWVMSYDDGAKKSRKRPLILEDGAWKKVRSVIPAGTAETWNLEVADDHSYTAEGCIVKNCPLQWDIVDRLILRYSNEGELVFDPFGGLGTVPLRARKLGRRGRASELNPVSFRDAVMYQRELDFAEHVPTLFDLAGEVN